jgi:hypothetical protein
MTTERPSSIPDGLILELSRGKVLPGKSDEADRWIKMLNDRQDECVSTLDRDHQEQAKRTKEPGWVEAEPQLLLLPEPVKQAILSWALRPQADSPR